MRRRHLAATILTLAMLVTGLSVAATAAPAAATTHDPVYHVPRATLKAALHCPTTFHRTHQPVLLVHGTFATGEENYGWNYLPELATRGFDACYVDLPNRELDDIQIASEYVVFAIRRIHALTGMKVDILGHSQGGLEPRWALRWWPSLRSEVSDLVTLSTPNHGTSAASVSGAGCAACFQMAPASKFIGALNSGDETPGRVDYTNLYTTMADELVIPATSAKTHGGTNIAVQAVCPGRVVDHVTMAADRTVLLMVLDAFTHKGGTVVSRLPSTKCDQPQLFPSDPTAALTVLEGEVTAGHVPNGSLVTAEPPLRGYATR